MSANRTDPTKIWFFIVLGLLALASVGLIYALIGAPA